jgi:hypothetical protein
MAVAKSVKAAGEWLDFTNSTFLGMMGLSDPPSARKVLDAV